MQDKDRAMDMKLHAELHMRKGRFTISLVVHLLLIMWITATWSFLGPPMVVVMRSGTDNVADGMVTFIGTKRTGHMLWSYYRAKRFAHLVVPNVLLI